MEPVGCPQLGQRESLGGGVEGGLNWINPSRLPLIKVE